MNVIAKLKYEICILLSSVLTEHGEMITYYYQE